MTGVSGLGFAISFLIKEHDLDVIDGSTHHFRFNQRGERQPSPEEMAERRSFIAT